MNPTVPRHGTQQCPWGTGSPGAVRPRTEGRSSRARGRGDRPSRGGGPLRSCRSSAAGSRLHPLRRHGKQEDRQGAHGTLSAVTAGHPGVLARSGSELQSQGNTLCRARVRPGAGRPGAGVPSTGPDPRHWRTGGGSEPAARVARKAGLWGRQARDCSPELASSLLAGQAHCWAEDGVRSTERGRPRLAPLPLCVHGGHAERATPPAVLGGHRNGDFCPLPAGADSASHRAGGGAGTKHVRLVRKTRLGGGRATRPAQLPAPLPRPGGTGQRSRLRGEGGGCLWEAAGPSEQCFPENSD